VDGRADADAAGGYVPFFFTSRDGLRLAGRDYAPPDASRLPVVCLPGLTRTSRDFHRLALALSREDGRRVVSFDLRGRGASAWAADGLTYAPPVEAEDVLAGLAEREIERAAFIGTSRGGIVTMAIAAMAPNRIAATVLNDIGSRIDTAGLLRIKAYIGKPLPPLGWPQAGPLLRAGLGADFPAYADADWEELARLTFANRDGMAVLDYDPRLAAGFEAITEASAPVDLSAAFAALCGVPVLVIRGSHSQLLSRETVAAMQAAHPGLETIEAPGEGHPPLLRGALLAAVRGFLDRIDPPV